MANINVSYPIHCFWLTLEVLREILNQKISNNRFKLACLIGINFGSELIDGKLTEFSSSDSLNNYNEYEEELALSETNPV